MVVQDGFFKKTNHAIPHCKLPKVFSQKNAIRNLRNKNDTQTQKKENILQKDS